VDAPEAELVTWLATCHPDDQVEAAARAVLERGLRQRRTAPSAFDERRTTKALTTRLERTTDLYRWGHIGKGDYPRERAATEAELAQLQGQPGRAERQAVLGPNHRPSRRMGGRHPRPALAVSVEH